jgi:hypothetical protein
MHHPPLMDDRVALWRQRAAQGEAFIQFAHLAEVDQAQSRGAADRAFGRFQLATQQAQQRGFAAAVRAHQSHFHARGQNEVEPGKQAPGFRG